ncbi:hypothetical protein GWD52_01325 [Enterobacteriaceae bacterium 4M9]|nr:hypothetical protein [Enterobacteriaceae bacterium 4M9]
MSNTAQSVTSATFNTIHTGADIVLDLTQAATGYVFNVTEAVVQATANTGETFVSELVGTTQDQLQSIVGSMKDGIAQIGSGIDNSVTAVQNIVVSGVQTVGAGVHTVTDSVGGVLPLAVDALHLKINPGDYLAYIGSVASDVGTTISDARAFVGYSLTAAQGGGFHFGNSDGLLGINMFASLIGNGTDVTNVIPDYRGSNGPVPFNFAIDGQSVLVGAELPFTPLLAVALPVLAPINTGGIGIVTVFDSTGFDVKLYTVAGPSVNIGPLNVGATTEVGNYSQINLLSWHGLATGDLPVAGGLLGSIPLVNTLSVPVPALDLGIESQVYSQSILNLSAFGIGPKAQVELVNSLNNDAAIVGGVVIPTIDSAANGVNDVLQAILLQDGGSSAPAVNVPVQLVGNDIASDNGLWAA